MKKLLSALIALVAATGLWLYVVTVVSPGAENTYTGIPVALSGTSILTERGLMITSGENQTVSLTLAGNRSDLNNINSSNITLVADLTKIYEPGVQTLDYTYSLPGNIPNNAVTVQNWNPKHITITVEERVSKEIPVKISYIGSVPAGFIADKENSTLDYPVVSATGPASVMNRIESAIIEVNLEGRSESLSESFRYTLCDAEDQPVDVEMVTTNIGEIRMELRIQRVKELPLTITVIDGGGATKETSSITIDPQAIRISGSDALLERYTEYNLGTINLAEIFEDTDLTFEIALDEGITNLSGVTQVTVSIQFPALMTREFAVKNITAENVPEGMEAEILSQAVLVKVRGTRKEIEALTEKDISITVDFRNGEPGTYTTKAHVTISGKFPNVGCLGNYSVSATLTKVDAGRAAASDETEE